MKFGCLAKKILRRRPHRVLHVGQEPDVGEREVRAGDERRLRELPVHDRAGRLEALRGGLDDARLLRALEDVLVDELHRVAAELRRLDADPLLHLRAAAEIAGDELPADLLVEVATDGARLEELEAVVFERGDAAEGLAAEVRLLLVLALGEVDELELVRRVVLGEGHQHLARARAHRVSVDLDHRRPPSGDTLRRLSRRRRKGHRTTELGCPAPWRGCEHLDPNVSRTIRAHRRGGGSPWPRRGPAPSGRPDRDCEAVTE